MDPPGSGSRAVPIVIDDVGDQDDSDLQRALELSLQQAQPAAAASPPYAAASASHDNDEEDADLKAALALSLQRSRSGTTTPPPPLMTTNGALIVHDDNANAATNNSMMMIEDDDEALQRALALSLQDASPTYRAVTAAAGPMVVAAATRQRSSPHDTSSTASEEDDEEDRKPAAVPTVRIVEDVHHTASNHSSAVSFHNNNNPWGDSASSQIMIVPTAKPLPTLAPTAVQNCYYQTAQPYDLAAFHEIMWDASLTTESDQQRWVQQGIDVRGVDDMDDSPMNKPAENDEPTSKAPSPTPEQAATSPTATTVSERSRLEQLAANHRSWGLVQHHGGPCGVLAAVQAELLQHLIWGAPASTSPRTTSTSTTTITHAAWLEALARSIGTILARVAMAETTTNNGSSSATAGVGEEQQTAGSSTTEEADSATTSTGGGSSSGHGSTTTTNNNSNTVVNPLVRLVLPREQRPLTWEDLLPAAVGAAAEDSFLLQHSLTLSSLLTEQQVGDENTTTTSEEEANKDHNDDRTAKRQKMTEDDDPDSREQRLADAVTAFLLHPRPPPPSSTAAAAAAAETDNDAAVQEERAPTNNNSSGDDDNKEPQSPINQFRHAGGVILLVMSLLATRAGRNNNNNNNTTNDDQQHPPFSVIRDDFDDPVGTRLTAQFGHCSQELINLLLTGRAVSNVFDYSLRPSGDMLCRGIGARPAVGYLSQLESMRYCQVGSFYKSPHYPVWVVGSTSHFTVMWGPRAALTESPSDALLEDCRRAFKSVEGGEENGFVAVDQLSAVLKQLEQHVKLQDNEISLVAAALEVNGAGIILWDDFWKTTSRLSTGASLERVLAGSGDIDDDSLPNLEPATTTAAAAPVVEAASVVAVAPAARPGTATPETDEEMAARLAWEDSSVGAVTGGSPLNLPSDNEDEPKKPPPPSSSASSSAPEAMVVDTGSNSVKPPPPPTAAAPSAAVGGGTLDFERLGKSFPLYHYNGLRGGVLTSFRVTRLSPEEAVGASIALNRDNPNSGSNSSVDLEDVVRTKWPSCAINWLGQSPPYID